MLKILPFVAFALILSMPLSARGVREEQETLIPKRETGVLEFLKKHPEFDGRGVVIAVLDTGVDPAAAGLQTTSTGERKIVDLIDGTGAGDVDTSRVVERAKDGTLEGLTGRTLKLPKKLKNPSGKFHIGIKRGYDLFHPGVRNRVRQLRSKAWEEEYRRITDQRRRDQAAAEKEGERKAFKKAADDRTLDEKDEVARESLLGSLEEGFMAADPGPVYDCVVWSDGKQFRVIVDTDEDGDLADETVLRPFGVAGEYASFGEREASHFSVQVYEDGDLLSIVTVSGSHGSHVAAIAAANFPDEPHRNGIAPGARILSVKIGDIRSRGSSTGVGEMRSVAACAQYGVDIMNASWGGASQFQDGSSTSARLYELLVKKYGVTAFVSVGNSGPALSTLGSPGGTTQAVIGIGAYVSPEMARVLHSQTLEAPSTAYNFTSRGPTKGGDLGVDVMGPGGAVASLAYEDLRKSQNYVGTSMSSPSVAGVGALLVSAAKQSDVPYSPPRIRAALMNGARFLEGVETFAQGAGLAQVLPAWEHLKTNAEQPAWDCFYEINNEDNTFGAGPGLYLRGEIPAGERQLRFDITPDFLESAKNVEKFALEEDLVFSATAPWIKVPEYARLGGGRITIRPIADVPGSKASGEQVFFGEIHASLASSPDAGPLFRIPLTIVRGRKMDPRVGYRGGYEAELESGVTNRQFFLVPAYANRVKVRVSNLGEESRRKTYVLQVLTITAHESFPKHHGREYFTLGEGDERDFTIPVAAGKTTEIALQQPYSTVGSSELKVDVQFVGVSADQDLVLLRENDEYVPLDLVSATNIEVKPEGSIDRAHFVKMPDKTEFLSPDKRHEMPPGPKEAIAENPPFLRQTFSLSVEKPTKIQLEPGRQFNTGLGVSSGLLTFYHESGKLLYQGQVMDRPSVELPKGKTTVYRDLRSLSRQILEREQDRPLSYSYKVEKPRPLEVFLTGREALAGGKTTRVLLRAGRHQGVIVGGSDLASLGEMKPAPDYFSGELKLVQGEDETVFEIDVECRPGADFKKVTNQDPKPQPRDKKKSRLEKLDDELFQRRLAFVDSTKFTAEADEKTKRDELLEALLKKKPDDADLLMMRATILAGHAGLLSEWHQKPPASKDSDESEDKEPENSEGNEAEKAESNEEEKEPSNKTKKKGKKETDSNKAEPELKPKELRKKIFADLKKARELSGPSDVAAYFGAREDVSDGTIDEKKEAAEEAKKMEESRKRLASLGRLRSDVQLQLGQLEASRRSLDESRRWEDTPGKSSKQQELALLTAEERYGLALKILKEQLKEAPFDKKLLERQLELYEKLGFDDRWSDRVRLQMKMRENRVALPQ
ncbi:MAG: S8 family serine peptidase [Verrucomicrobiota bacterium]